MRKGSDAWGLVLGIRQARLVLVEVQWLAGPREWLPEAELRPWDKTEAPPPPPAPVRIEYILPSNVPVTGKIPPKSSGLHRKQKPYRNKPSHNRKWEERPELSPEAKRAYFLMMERKRNPNNPQLRNGAERKAWSKVPQAERMRLRGYRKG